MRTVSDRTASEDDGARVGAAPSRGNAMGWWFVTPALLLLLAMNAFPLLFNVYLSTTGPTSRRQYVGTLSFFGVGYRSGHGALPGRTFDVTEQLQALKGQSPQLPELEVVFEATDGTAESTPEKAGPLNRQAGLRVGSVRLRVQG